MKNNMKKIWSKIPKWLKIAVPAVLALLVIVFFVVGWYFSNKFIAVKLQKVEYDQTVQAVNGEEYTISGSAYDVDGIMGGIRTDGTMIGIYSAPQVKDVSAKTSTRKLTALNGTKPAIGDKISLQGNIWTTDPKTALNIDYQNITYEGPLGTMDAWLVPSPGSSKWTIAVHGIGAHKREMLRFIKPINDAGNNMMIISYRNDEGNPKSPDNFFHLGDTEWEDLQAAVRYAKTQGATDISLFGVSLGGSITENYLRRSLDIPTTNISHVILDSPALNWNEILRFQAQKAGYPSFIFFPATVSANIRAGINLERISTGPENIKHKTLLIHNADDPTVPQRASKQLAETRQDLITFIDFGTGGHVRAWNHDRQRYEQIITSFLAN